MTERSNLDPTELRDRLFEVAATDLLGPAGGENEEIPEGSVRDRYLVGQLAPKGSVVDPSEIDGMDGSDEKSEEGENERDTLPSRSLAPSSIGLTFCVDADCDGLEVEAGWGHYRRAKSENWLTESGEAKTVWIREQARGVLGIPLRPGPIETTAPDPERPDVVIEGRVRKHESAHWLVTVFLVNRQTEPEENRDEAWLFQPEISVRGRDGSAVFRRRPAAEGTAASAERAALEMLYRHRLEFAIGHGVGVHARPAEDSPDRAVEVRTRVIPAEDVPVTEPPGPDDPGFEGLADLVLDMQALAEMEEPDLAAALEVLPREYEKWIRRQKKRVEDGALGAHAEAARAALGRCRVALDRLREGVRVLGEDATALEAFRFANRAMALQRVRSIYSRERRQGKEVEIETLDVPRNRSWYPFQLAFLLITLPSLADPLHRDRTSGAESIADLLWFPTGGGKTEAYLGAAAFAMAIRRLQGTVGDRDGTHGVAVIMRYTLRLLTLQQFQRGAALLCAMEVLRREAEAAGGRRWGDTPFRIGLWVGAGAAPNRTRDAAEWVTTQRGNRPPTDRGSSPAQLTACPWCGSEIRPGRDIIVATYPDAWRTCLYCSDKYGECPFSYKSAPEEGLPVVVVDEELYRLLPAMIVATVDKFAQMPWVGETQALFGRVSGICPRHGYLTPALGEESRGGESCRGRHPKRGSLPRTTEQPTPWLRPPDLVIQDELHLISGPLGTMVGLYESAIDELCSWSLDEETVRPKVIASTATVRRAREQVHSLFARDLAIFPPHGLEISDNFFSLQRPLSEEDARRSGRVGRPRPGRRYLGICAPGKSRPSVLIRVYVAFLCAAEKLFAEQGAAADPWMTAVGYFNSLRELGGMKRLVEDDVKTRAYRVERTDIERPGLAQRDVFDIKELTSRVSSAEIPKILDALERPFERGGGDEERGIDVLLATNMLSVGVDVGRLGLMLVNGQPKTTAEYIQATSRVGRRWPGLVATVLNWARPRDLSHYESFEHYHATFYGFVEALSLTPFAPRAVDRGLTGVLASLVRLDDAGFNPNPGAGRLDDPEMGEKAGDTLAARAWTVTDRAEVRDEVRAQSKDRFDRWAKEAQVEGRTLGYRGRRDGETVGLLLRPDDPPWRLFTTPTSMREVEPSVNLMLEDRGEEQLPDWGSTTGSEGDGSGGS